MKKSMLFSIRYKNIKKIGIVYLFKLLRHVKFLKFLGHKSLRFQIWRTWIKILLGSYIESYLILGRENTYFTKNLSTQKDILMLQTN